MPVEVDDVAHASEQVAKVAWGDVPAGVVGESIEALVAAGNQQDLALLLAVRSFEARAEHRGEGHTQVASWLAHHCRLRKTEARRIARLARFLARLPVVEDALRAGTVGLAHLEVLAEAHRERDHEAWVAAVPLLLEYAAGARFEDFARHVRRFADRLAPEDAEERFKAGVDDRYVTSSTTLDGFGFLRGWLDPFAQQLFTTEHQRLIQQLLEEDWAAAKAVLGRDPEPVELVELTRSHGQRTHDAFAQMAVRSRALRGPTAAAGVETLIHIDGETFLEALRHLLADDPDDQAHYPPRGFAETAQGQPISPIAAVYLALLGQVRGIVFDEHGTILTYGRSRRLFTPGQAAAVRAKFRRCCHPFGCDRTGPLLQTDHVREHRDGGATDTTNAEPLCDPHHKWKTNQHGKAPPPGRRDTDQRRAPPPNLP